MNRVIVYIGGRSIVYVGSRSIVYVDSLYGMYGVYVDSLSVGSLSVDSLFVDSLYVDSLYVDSLYVSRSICFLLKFSCASFVWVRLENLPFPGVELNVESFISSRCPRSVLSCVGAFIYTAGSLLGLGTRTWGSTSF